MLILNNNWIIRVIRVKKHTQVKRRLASKTILLMLPDASEIEQDNSVLYVLI